MKIRRVICRGFKTYRDAISVGEFDSKLNSIVGFNGSGKSSLFQAIIFVLSPNHGGLCSAGTFLHEGSNGKALTGFVELELENSNRSFPVDSDVVSLRRTIIGVNRNDEYLVNGKHVTRPEYITLLQTAGLVGAKPVSRKKRRGPNALPYYIVEQGRVTSVATISDADRFELVKEAAGIEVYSEKKAESMEILEETKGKEQRIDELLAEIETKYTELESESKELMEFSKLKSEKEAVEYRLGTLELAQLGEVKSGLQATLNGHQHALRTQETLLEELREREAVIEAEIQKLSTVTGSTKQALELRVAEINRRISAKRNERSAASVAIDKAATQIAEIDRMMADLDAKRTLLENSIEADWNKLNGLKLNVNAKERLKADVQTRLSAAEALTSAESLDERETEVRLVLGSLGRKHDMVKNSISEKEAELAQLVQREIPAKQTQVNERAELVNSLESAESGKVRRQAEITTAIREKNSQVFSVKQQLFELQRESDRLCREFKDVSGSVLRSTTFNARDLVTRSDIEGVKGMFGDFLRIPSMYRAAVEASCRGALFNVVISDDKVADTIASKIAGGRGRVTLTPINRVGDDGVAAARLAADILAEGYEAQLLSSVVRPRDGASAEEKEWIGRLVLKFFARTAVVETIQVGVEVARRFGIDTATVDGDIVTKDLVVKGGSDGKRRSGQVVKNWQQSIELKTRIDAIKVEMKTLEDTVVGVQAEISALTESQVGSVGVDPKSIETARESLGAGKRELSLLVEKRRELELYELRNLKDIDLVNSVNERTRLEAELVSIGQRRSAGATEGLSEPARLARIRALHVELEDVENQLAAMEKEVHQLSQRINMNRSELTHFVEHRCAHLTELRVERQRELAHLTTVSEKLAADVELIEGVELLAAQADLDEEERNLAKDRERATEMATELESIRTEKTDAETTMGDIQSSIRSVNQQIESVDADIVRSTSALRNASSIPTPCADVEMDIPAACRCLRSRIIAINTHLDSPQFAYVNRKSIEQLERISGERQQLQAKKTEIEKSHTAIQELLTELNRNELTILHSAFGRVKDHFVELFGRITDGAGLADMTLTMADDGSDSVGSVNVEVSFPVQGGEKPARSKRLNELSGGQRTVVALCFLLSLHKAVDTQSNFFILDEVDAALDPNYRAAIAEALFEESVKGVQFLFTSFRPEFCAVATKHWLVSMANGTSKVSAVDIATAMGLVNGDDSVAIGEEAVAEEQQSVLLRE